MGFETQANLARSIHVYQEAVESGINHDTAVGGFFGATAEFLLKKVKEVEKAGGEFYLLKLSTAS